MEKFENDLSLYIIEGLQSSSGMLLNGRLVQAMGGDRESGRIMVRINPQDVKRYWKKVCASKLRSPCPDEIRAVCNTIQSMLSWEAFDAPVLRDLLPSEGRINDQLFDIFDTLGRFRCLMWYDGNLNQYGQRTPDFRPPLWIHVFRSIGVLLLHFNTTKLEAAHENGCP